MKLIVIVIMVLCLPLAYAQIGIDGVIKSPEEINPGDKINLEIILSNEGNKDVEGVRISLELTDLPFAPLESSEKIIDEIEKESRTRVVFLLKSLPDAKPGIYKIPITLFYQGNKSTAVSSITLNSNPVLQVDIEESSLISILKKGKIVIRLVNIGDSEIKFLAAHVPRSLDYEVLSQNSFYIGNIDSDDFETIEIELILKKSIQTLPLEVSYKDSFNNEFKKTYNLEIRTYTPEEALQLGLTKKNNPYIFVTLILILGLILLYRSYRKRKK